MNFGKAMVIFDNIENATESVLQKGMAIRTVLDLETHNGITKAQMLKVMNWMWNQIFEMKRENE